VVSVLVTRELTNTNSQASHQTSELEMLGDRAKQFLFE
jgi:hypothetical protein